MRIVQPFWTAGRFKASNEVELTKCYPGPKSGWGSAMTDEAERLVILFARIITKLYSILT